MNEPVSRTYKDGESFGIKLFVDDWRDPPPGWHLAVTITEAIRLLEGGFVDVLSLDHDIQVSALSSVFSEETYATVARYVAVMPKDRLPKVVYFHTANDGGAALMGDILDGIVPTVRIVQDGTSSYKQTLLEEERLREELEKGD